MSTVILTGAGASRTFGYPMTTEFFNNIINEKREGKDINLNDE
ncbi:MAG: hypothetical protein U9Q30_02265 [Campylobacterota bacterium]|nr:hypothetical protein [Campylobacterota bacterium]